MCIPKYYVFLFSVIHIIWQGQDLTMNMNIYTNGGAKDEYTKMEKTWGKVPTRGWGFVGVLSLLRVDFPLLCTLIICIGCPRLSSVLGFFCLILSRVTAIALPSCYFQWLEIHSRQNTRETTWTCIIFQVHHIFFNLKLDIFLVNTWRLHLFLVRHKPNILILHLENNKNIFFFQGFINFLSFVFLIHTNYFLFIV